MELVPDKAFPCFVKEFLRIIRSPEPVRSHCTALCRIGDLLVPPVVELHGSLGCIAARSMDIHQKLSVPYRKLGVVLIRQIILVQAVALGTYYLHRAVACKTVLHCTDRLDSRGSAGVACTVVMIDGVYSVVLGKPDKTTAVAQVLITELSGVVVRIGHKHDPRAVDTLPEAYLERNLAVSVERPVPPLQLLC